MIFRSIIVLFLLIPTANMIAALEFHQDITNQALWQRTYGGINNENAYSIIQTSDGGYAIAGDRFSDDENGFDQSFWLVKTDNLGNEEWNSTYGIGEDSWESAQSVIETLYGGYLLVGNKVDFRGQTILVIKTDDVGTEEWNVAYQSINNGSSHARSLLQTFGGGDMR